MENQNTPLWDASLGRFQPVMVDEPTEAESIEILKGLRSRYEEHHKVTIQDEALVAAVRLSAAISMTVFFRIRRLMLWMKHVQK